MTPDRELLRLYSEAGDEAAFAELVHRHLPVVYAAALRLLSGNAELAKDVAQEVFTDLARKARWLCTHPTLVGWLHTSTRFRASKAIRAESRRQTREQEAALMTDHPASPSTSDLPWEQLRPKLDEALGQLSETDRNAVLLRFFQDKSFTEVAAILNLNESVAHKRVERAMEKMRRYFARSGFEGSTALLATTLDAQTVAPLPAGLAVQVTENALAKTTLAMTMTSAGLFYTFARTIFMSTKIKLAIAVVVIISSVWWFLQPAPMPVKIAAATSKPVVIPEFQYSIDPKSPMLHPPPSAPIVPAAAQPRSPQSPNLVIPAPTPATDPQANLKTTFPDIARLIRAGDMAAYRETYEVPNEFKPQDVEQMRKNMATIAETYILYPQIRQTGQQSNEAYALAYEALADQTPTLNAAGDEATYMMTLNNTLLPVIFVKINGKWYIKEDGAWRAGDSVNPSITFGPRGNN